MLSALTEWPVVAILLLDLVLCTYLAILFKSKYKVAFYLHPITLWISSLLFETSFLAAGDGKAYKAVVATYLNSKNLSFNFGNLLQEYGILGFLKYTSLGVVPVFALPEFFFGNPSHTVYYLWQGTFHVALCAIVFTLARTWRVVDEKALFSMALFAVVSPSFFDLGSCPTRYIVLFSGVFLLFIAHLAVVQRTTITRWLWFAVAVLMVLISKAPLMAPYLIFAAIDLIFIRRIRVNAKLILLVGVLAFGVMAIGAYLYESVLRYEETAKYGAATFSYLTRLPVIGWVVKYVYALLAPFPWSQASYFIATTYCGNELLFFMHILSSLTGLYLFFVVILKWRAILASDTELKQMVAYGLIMSLSILWGAVGFHVYLLIYFPMLAPLLGIKRFRINPLIPIQFAAILEAFMLLAK